MTESVNPSDENVQETAAEGAAKEPASEGAASAKKPTAKKVARKTGAKKSTTTRKTSAKKPAKAASADGEGYAASDGAETPADDGASEQASKAEAAPKAAKKTSSRSRRSSSASEKKRLGEKIFSQGTVVAKTSFNGPLTPETDVLTTDPVNPKAIASEARAAAKVASDGQGDASADVENDAPEAPETADEDVLEETAEKVAEEPKKAPAAAPKPKGPKTTMARPPKGLTENTPAGAKVEPIKPKRHPVRTVLIVAIIAAAVAAIVYFFILPPSLSNNEVLAAFDSSEISNEQLTNSAYANNGGYSMSGTKVTSIDDVDTGQKTAHVEATFENSNFEVTVECQQAYTLVQHKWNAGEVKIVSSKAKPLTSVDSTKVVADISNLLSKVPDKNGAKLADLYADGTFEVMSNNLNSDKNEATVTIRAKKSYDLYSYSGQITAVFDFEEGSGDPGDAGSWQLTSCKTDDAAWQQSYSSLVGTWTGKLENTASSSLILNTGKCYAGKTTPFTMNVESMDPTTGAMVATMTFVSHNHAAISKDADSTQGDMTVTATDISVSLDPQTLTGTYEFAGDETQGTYLITLVNDGGVWKVQVASGLFETGTLAGLGHVTFTDVYTLTHA